MNLNALERRLDALERTDKGEPKFVHCISAADGDTDTVARMKHAHIEAGLGSDDDIWVHLRRLTEAENGRSPTIHSNPVVKAHRA